MARGKPPMFWQCAHELPVVVEKVEGDKKVARCLGCGQSGPAVGGGAEGALLALRIEARRRDGAEERLGHILISASFLALRADSRSHPVQLP